MSSVHRTRSITQNENKRFKKDEDKFKASTFDFKEKTWKDDLTLIVENRRLFVTKAVLAHASPVFDRMFQADFKEKGRTELDLPGKKVTDVIHFLRCIYPDALNFAVCPQNVLSVVPLAEEYQCSNLKSRCEACLLGMISKPIANDKLYEILGLASMYNMPELLERCMDIASDLEVDALYSAEKEITISLALKAKILEKMVLKLQPKTFLEVLKNYYESINGKEKLDIGDYSKWDGKSFRCSVSLNQSKSLEFRSQGSLIKCTVLINASNMFFNKVSITFETGIILGGQIVGTLVVKPSVRGKENIAKQFRFHIPGASKELSWTDISPGNKANGYLYHDTFDIELNVLFEKNKNIAFSTFGFIQRSLIPQQQ